MNMYKLPTQVPTYIHTSTTEEEGSASLRNESFAFGALTPSIKQGPENQMDTSCQFVTGSSNSH